MELQNDLPQTNEEIIQADSAQKTADEIAFAQAQAFNHPAMKTTAELLARYGNPIEETKAFEDKWMDMFELPDDIHQAIPVLPHHIYLNKDIESSLVKILRRLIAVGAHKEIKTFDGCFNIRAERGSTTISRHSWGIALDLNASWEAMYKPCHWSEAFMEVWRTTPGWICGADFHSRSDPMHFEFTAYNAF